MITVVYSSSDFDKEIALTSALDVSKVLNDAGYFTRVCPLEDLSEELISKSETIFTCDSFPAPTWMQDGAEVDTSLKAYLETNSRRFTGSSYSSSCIAKNKLEAKKIWRDKNISTPKWCSFSQNISPFDYPYIVKPIKGSTSKGVHLVKSYLDFTQLVENNYINELCFIEEFIPGIECTIGVITKNQTTLALEPLVLELKEEILSFESKTQKERYPKISVISDINVKKSVQDLAVFAFNALGCTGYARLDIRISENLTPYVLELNVAPRLAERDYFGISAELFGMPYSELISSILIHTTVDEK